MTAVRIAVTGIGAVCAVGGDPEAVFDALCAGRSGIDAETPWPGVGPTARLAERTTGSRLARRVVEQALAGFEERDGLALVGASTAGDMVLAEETFRRDLAGERIEDPDAYLWPQLCYRPASEVAAALGIRGPVLTTSTACTSGGLAVGIAMDLIRTGRARAAVAFGTDVLCRTTTHGFASLGVHSGSGCRPFDADRDGMSLGEGAAALLLERTEDARSRGATVLAEVAGWASAQDAHHLSSPAPDGRGAIEALQAALRMAGTPPEAVGYVNAHGTGTDLNDEMEAGALARVVPRAPVSSTKGATGHTLGAAGTLEAVIALQALRRGLVPPNVGLRRSAFDLDLSNATRAADVEVAVSVNFAFGGHNTALVLRRA